MQLADRSVKSHVPLGPRVGTPSTFGKHDDIPFLPVHRQRYPLNQEISKWGLTVRQDFLYVSRFKEDQRSVQGKSGRY